MGVPLRQQLRVAGYIAKQKLMGRKRYPLVLMLEPLFRCNLACAGCGKIDYPAPILNQRLTPQQCWQAAEECGAPMVAVRFYVSLCTNALLLEKKLDLFEPSPYLFFSVHLDGLQQHHDRAVCQEGVFEKAVQAIKAAQARGFRVNVNATIFEGYPAAELADFLDYATGLGVGISISPGFAYERAPDQAHFLNRQRTKEFFREVWRIGKARGGKWNLSHSPLFLDFLLGNQEMLCTPWGMPTRNVFGWQKPCYLLGEGYATSFAELMETTEWERYGTGAYEKCADCMAHCGYEPTAADIAFGNPLKMARLLWNGLAIEGPMAREIDLSKARPAEEHHDRLVAKEMDRIRGEKAA